MKKKKIYTFLDGYYLMVIDSLIGRWGNKTSEVTRKILERWIDDNRDVIEELITEKEEAVKKGYVEKEGGK